MKMQVIYDAAGRVTGIRHAWTFDGVYSSFATQGLQSKKKGVFTRQELASLAEINMESLKDPDYFTQGKLNGKKAAFGDPVEYWLEYEKSVLTLHFTLPFKSPEKARALELAVYDPLYFVDLTPAENEPVALSGAPVSCRLTVSKGQDIVAAPGQSIGDAYFHQLESRGYGSQFANNIYVTCP
jgi:ABC-type uncharacterized transport system substrate-binding protein